MVFKTPKDVVIHVATLLVALGGSAAFPSSPADIGEMRTPTIVVAILGWLLGMLLSRRQAKTVEKKYIRIIYVIWILAAIIFFYCWKSYYIKMDLYTIHVYEKYIVYGDVYRPEIKKYIDQQPDQSPAAIMKSLPQHTSEQIWTAASISARKNEIRAKYLESILLSVFCVVFGFYTIRNLHKSDVTDREKTDLHERTKVE